jgi:hypothetical protein
MGYNADDQLFYGLAYEAGYKQCPLCQYWVDKLDGSDHILCKCGFSFCHRCGGVQGRCMCVGFSNYIELKELKLKQSQLLTRQALKIQRSIREVAEARRQST